MFRYIKLHNYGSLVNFEVDLTNKKNSPRKMVLVYGENGIGKSNFANAFYTLIETMRTMLIKNKLESLLIRIQEIEDQEVTVSLSNALRNKFKGIEAIISSYKTVDTQDDMILEYGFRCNGKNGRYVLQIGNKEIVAERLEYVQNRKQAVFFEVVNGQIVTDNIFKAADYRKEIYNLVEKYWGKHSLLAIMMYELQENASAYTKKNIPVSLMDVIDFLGFICIRVNDGNQWEKKELTRLHAMLKNFSKGSVPKSETKKIDKTEKLVNMFFTSLYSDIKQVYYEKEYRGDNIYYTLRLKKLMYNKLIDLNFDLESTGTKLLLELLPFLLAAAEGRTVIIDEIDSGIHDLLASSLLLNLRQYLKGQIIVTTHNTMLLESELSKDCVYIFTADKNANKELLPLSAFEERIHPNLNIRKRYLKGMYGGTPISMDIDFDNLLDSLD